jgi:hypothetical protein
LDLLLAQFGGFYLTTRFGELSRCHLAWARCNFIGLVTAFSATVNPKR